MSDLIAFLRARLDEDEASARAATPGPWRAVTSAELEKMRARDPDDRPEDDRPWTRPVMSENESRSDGDKVHIARHDPARVLREIEVKRAILEWHQAQCTCDWCTTEGADLAEPDFAPACPTLCFLAAIWSDHPDYRQEWKPLTPDEPAA